MKFDVLDPYATHFVFKQVNRHTEKLPGYAWHTPNSPKLMTSGSTLLLLYLLFLSSFLLFLFSFHPVNQYIVAPLCFSQTNTLSVMEALILNNARFCYHGEY